MRQFSDLSREEIRELMGRQKAGYEAMRVQRWRDIRRFDPQTDWSDAVELLDLAVSCGLPPRPDSGLVEWYRALARQSHE